MIDWPWSKKKYIDTHRSKEATIVAKAAKECVHCFNAKHFVINKYYNDVVLEIIYVCAKCNKTKTENIPLWGEICEHYMIPNPLRMPIALEVLWDDFRNLVEKTINQNERG